MVISGSLVARCKECKCRWNWNMDNFPFADAEIVGTCSNCLDRIDHDCVDEFILVRPHVFKKVGRKEFGGSKKMKAVLCPVCLGKGTIPDDYLSILRKKCHGCDGTGWVAVPEE